MKYLTDMDYKITALPTTVEVKDRIVPELNGLYFGTINQNRILFDYTQYIEENKLTPVDIKVFMRSNKTFIEYILKGYNTPTSQCFYQNGNGHYLVGIELVFLCLAFVNPEVCLYFNGLVRDALVDGVAYSYGFIYDQAAENLPDDVLKDIINERRKNATGDN